MEAKAAAERIRKLIVVGDNRLKQGGGRHSARAREAFERALELAEEAGLADRFRPFIARRLADMEPSRGDDGLDSAP